MTNSTKNGNGATTPPPSDPTKNAPKSPFGPTQPSSGAGLSGLSAQDFAGTIGAAASPQSRPGIPNTSQPSPGQARPTVAHMMGEMVWLLTQSPLHKHFALADLEWMIMPALLLEQFRVFRDGNRPVGLALWGYLNEEAEKKVIAGSARLRPDEWKSGDRLWLIELIAPFHTAENKMVERMLTDLTQAVLSGKELRLMQMDASSGERRTTVLNRKT